MQKFLTLTFCMILSSASLCFAQEADFCSDGSGTLVTGKDGTEYCKSNQSMNWWSAITWCDAVGGKLIDQKEYDNLENIESFVWTISLADEANAYVFNFENSKEKTHKIKTDSYNALCVKR